MNIYLLVLFIAIIAGNILFNIFKKRQGEGSKAPDVVTIIGLVIGLALGITPVFSVAYKSGLGTLQSSCLVLLLLLDASCMAGEKAEIIKQKIEISYFVPRDKYSNCSRIFT
ncbi:hypothetical protein HPL003_11100 [Paenibacillus terrae HPL-003]|uniref:Uncharacterized protein n=1 Tax=Paenibacillus terrae (strain HPL-003) TaxID=985665 RepID=G7VXD8_PAETH|nr:hypothetical protein HPL003_11100 [Paenibacillus terrae HPL-003]